RLFRGRVPQPSSIVLPTLLLTTRGRISGQERTVPLIYLRAGDAFVVANARPEGERRNPWVANLRSAGAGRVKLGGLTVEVTARELHDAELERWWPRLCEVWPAFAEHHAATGERAVFALQPADEPNE
ncbi:MAG: nitroreductase family deazaflavin-dependent oxidoreductase, partial [Acidimicrobiia bacterium]|nr:nitroreductase family deazaflavin-dependent oxidoreductase [Acidimicrobiia bacterium]